jgi:hypothetical protein
MVLSQTGHEENRAFPADRHNDHHNACYGGLHLVEQKGHHHHEELSLVASLPAYSIPVLWSGGTVHPFFLDIPVNKIAPSCQKNDFKQADAAADAATDAATCSSNAAEQHASQHASHNPAGHAPHEPSASLLLNGAWRRRILLPRLTLLGGRGGRTGIAARTATTGRAAASGPCIGT